jgi:RHS repeat-associated protein
MGIKPLDYEPEGSHRFTYMGVEKEESTDFHETDHRSYDSQLGRMHQVDKMAEKYTGITPYNYSFNNPILFNDPSGLDPIDLNQKKRDAVLKELTDEYNKYAGKGMTEEGSGDEGGGDGGGGGGGSSDQTETVVQNINLTLWGESSDLSASMTFPVYMKVDKDGGVQKVFFDTEGAGKKIVSDGFTMEMGLVSLDDDETSSVFSLYLNVVSKGENIELSGSASFEKGAGSIGASANLPTVRLSNDESQSFKMTIEVRKGASKGITGTIPGTVLFSNFPDNIKIVKNFFRGGDSQNYLRVSDGNVPWLKQKKK